MQVSGRLSPLVPSTSSHLHPPQAWSGGGLHRLPRKDAVPPTEGVDRSKPLWSGRTGVGAPQVLLGVQVHWVEGLPWGLAPLLQVSHTGSRGAGPSPQVSLTGSRGPGPSPQVSHTGSQSAPESG